MPERGCPSAAMSANQRILYIFLVQTTIGSLLSVSLAFGQCARDESLNLSSSKAVEI
jgi:hypothetical protein